MAKANAAANGEVPMTFTSAENVINLVGLKVHKQVSQNKWEVGSHSFYYHDLIKFADNIVELLWSIK